MATLLLSVDFEDWHQLVRRRVGAADWSRPGPALSRQAEVLLDLFDELGVRATFFVLGMAARAHPELVQEVVARGHEIGSHGDAHRPVLKQSREEFAADLRASRETIEELSGRTPIGYRAPAFSITRDCPWAYEVLAEEGFAYDASQHDSPRIRRRVAGGAATPHRLTMDEATRHPLATDAATPHPLTTDEGIPHRHPLSAGLWEFPVAVWRGWLPVGGASYWAVMPRDLVLRGLAGAGRFAGLYLHPHEFDPEPLRVGLGQGAPAGQRVHALAREAQRNAARRRAPGMLRAIAERFELIPYGEAYAELHGRAPART